MALRNVCVLYSVLSCFHTTGCEPYSFTTAGYGIFNLRTNFDACRTHEGGSGTNKAEQELTQRVFSYRCICSEQVTMNKAFMNPITDGCCRRTPSSFSASCGQTRFYAMSHKQQPLQVTLKHWSKSVPNSLCAPKRRQNNLSKNGDHAQITIVLPTVGTLTSVTLYDYMSTPWHYIPSLILFWIESQCSKWFVINKRSCVNRINKLQGTHTIDRHILIAFLTPSQPRRSYQGHKILSELIHGGHETRMSD